MITYYHLSVIPSSYSRIAFTFIFSPSLNGEFSPSNIVVMIFETNPVVTASETFDRCKTTPLKEKDNLKA